MLTAWALSCGHRHTVAETDWKKENLKGKVKVVYEKRFFLDSTGVLQDSSRWNKIDSFPNLTLTFNNLGYLVERIEEPCFFGGGTTWYVYDETNTKLQKIVHSANMDSGSAVSLFSYNKRGCLKQKISTYPDPFTNKKDSIVVNFVCDANGNIIKKIDNDVNDTNDVYFIRKYNHLNQVIEETKFDLDDHTPRTKLVNQYDDNGNMIYSAFMHLDGTRWGWVLTASYDDHGNLLKEESIYNHDGTPWKPAISYYRYEYDSLGNWIQKILTENGKDKEVTRRKIIYW
jgi:hypothetical protein